MLLEVLLHVLTLHQLKYNMKFVTFVVRIELAHEVLILYYSWVDEGLGNVELIVHILHGLFSKLSVVVDFPNFIDKFAWNTTDLDLEDVALSS